MTFRAVKPIDGAPYGVEIPEHSKSEVDLLIKKATASSHSIATQSPKKRALLLRTIAAEIEASRASLIELACAETALPEARIAGEITRTTVQFELFARLVETGKHLAVAIDKADPNYSPAPRPDIRKMNHPLGVVAIFAASNFPLAFSVAGGDAASAIAAGNAIVAKAHPSHPNTCATIESAIKSALKKCGLSEDLYSIVQGINPEITHWLALHDEVKAVGFTGSEIVGRILVNLAATRKEPIPVFAEMGSLNPVFVTKNAIADRSEVLAKGIIDSALMGSGQFCTKPGLVFTPNDTDFIETMKSHLATLSVAPLLSKSIAERYSSAIAKLSSAGKIEVASGATNEAGFGVTPTIFITDWATAAANHELLEEHFGPTTVVITCDENQYVEIASSLQGQLTATIQGTDDDKPAELLSILKEKAGRVIWNGFPTGVAVTSAMNHGGPWPSSSSHTTSVGTDAIYRFMRPVAYQGFAQNVLPEPLQDANSWAVPQSIN
ncbi:aldehyde dehydrogenase (NADP(+)) [Actinobacteria bacterium IMCC25003]|nr:aldehyde dehydrogenase (NADP(+)) [Actinobacteria bacterium IMCC25003]